MPRRQRELAAPMPVLGRSLVASAASYKGNEARVYHSDSKHWQREAYRHYRICGEARFAAQFFGHALSKTDLFVTADPRSTIRVVAGPAYERMEELFNGAGGQAAMLSAAGVHLTIAGEFYIVGREGPSSEDIWEVRSVMEVESNGVPGPGGKWWINSSGSQPRIELKATDTVIRVWIPDPQDALCADSPFRSLLGILEEIEWLTKYVYAQCSARVTSAGVWMVPEEVDFPPPQQDPTSPDVLEGNPAKAAGLIKMLADVVSATNGDPTQVSAKIPSVITVPGEFISAAKDGWMTFWTELDDNAQALREEAIKRFALGMDLPPERVLGMATSANTGGGHSSGPNHWTAWQVDEDTIKMHIEPMLDVVVAALSVFYLRPSLEGGTGTETIGYDTTSLRLRPDRSQESIELWDRGIVQTSVVLRENGFEVTDLMGNAERQQWFLWKVAGGSATPDMVAQALRMLGVNMPDPPDAADPNNQARPSPSLEDHPERALPDAQNALIAACDALAFRALERAGNKIRGVIRNAGGEAPNCSAFDVHTFTPAPEGSVRKLLEDAWPHADAVLEPLGVDVESTVAKLNGYVTALLTTGSPHSRVALVKWMGGEPPEAALVPA